MRVVYLARDIPPLVMYCVNGKPRSHKIRIPTESTQRGHDVILFAILTKNDSFRSYSTFVYILLRAHILNINMRTYVSGCVRTDAYNLIFASYYYAPWTWPCTVYI